MSGKLKLNHLLVLFFLLNAACSFSQWSLLAKWGARMLRSEERAVIAISSETFERSLKNAVRNGEKVPFYANGQNVAELMSKYKIEDILKMDGFVYRADDAILDLSGNYSLYNPAIDASRFRVRPNRDPVAGRLADLNQLTGKVFGKDLKTQARVYKELNLPEKVTRANVDEVYTAMLAYEKQVTEDVCQQLYSLGYLKTPRTDKIADMTLKGACSRYAKDVGKEFKWPTINGSRYTMLTGKTPVSDLDVLIPYELFDDITKRTYDLHVKAQLELDALGYHLETADGLVSTAEAQEVIRGYIKKYCPDVPYNDEKWLPGELITDFEVRVDEAVGDLATIGFESKSTLSTYESIARYREYHKAPAGDLFDLIERDKKLYDKLVKEGGDVSFAASSGEKLEMVRSADGSYESWVLKNGRIEKRVNGENAGREFERFLNEEVIQHSNDELTFVRFNAYEKDAEHLSVQWGARGVEVRVDDMHTWLDGGSMPKVFQELLANGEPSARYVLLLDDFFQSFDVAFSSGGVLKKVIDNPYAANSGLFNPQWLSNKFVEADADFYISASMESARINLARERYSPVIPEKSIAVSTSKEITDWGILKKSAFRFRKSDMNLYRNGETHFEEEIVFLVGHKDEGFKSHVKYLMENGALKDKYVVLISCHGEDDILLNQLLINNYTKGVLFYGETLSVDAVDKLLQGFSRVRAEQTVPMDLYDLMRKSIEYAKEHNSDIAPELDRLLRQSLYVFEYCKTALKQAA